MLLSVIIVSYNVKYFLEQCLFSVNKAAKQLETDPRSPSVEVIVVDNASQDGTVDYLSNRFLSVHFMRNEENIGFARANNLALQKARGNHILFLNPDTILPEEIFSACISFVQGHSSIGAVGVRMIDGSGRFLGESKRGFPTAWRSFCKLSGLSTFFPTSKAFSGYNLGHLNDRGQFPIDAVAGAFMLVRKEILDQVGGFDEQFFMYAEDIDLSKRIQQAGFENCYLGNLTILHFKGESTPKDSRYVKLFYEAMTLYIKKHYTGFGSRISVAVMNAGISIRSLFAKTTLKKESSPAPDWTRVQYSGDENEIRQLKTEMNNTRDDTSSQVMVICEGAGFSFQSVIETIEMLPATRLAMVHAAGSRSIVCSSDRSRQGFTIALTSL